MAHMLSMCAPNLQVMVMPNKIIYGTGRCAAALEFYKKTGGREGHSTMRNATFYGGEVEPCEEVTIFGDFPNIKAAYEGVKDENGKACVKVTVKKSSAQLAFDQVAKEAAERAKADAAKAGTSKGVDK